LCGGLSGEAHQPKQGDDELTQHQEVSGSELPVEQYHYSKQGIAAEQEFYQLLDKDGVTDNMHLFNDKLREWEDYYNYHRPHGALDGQTPGELDSRPARRVAPNNS